MCVCVGGGGGELCTKTARLGILFTLNAKPFLRRTKQKAKHIKMLSVAVVIDILRVDLGYLKNAVCLAIFNYT